MIAEQLRRRGLDVVAGQEPEQFARYGGIDDAQLFARAQDDRRAVVADNVGDSRWSTCSDNGRLTRSCLDARIGWLRPAPPG